MSTPRDTDIDAIPAIDIGILTLDEPSSAPNNSLPNPLPDNPCDDTQVPSPAASNASPRLNNPPYKRREREALPIPEFDPPPWQTVLESFPTLPIPDPQCFGHTELSNAHDDRARVSRILAQLPFRLPLPSVNTNSNISTSDNLNDLEELEFENLLTSTPDTLSAPDLVFAKTALFKHLRQGLALTTGSALGTVPPSVDECLRAYLVPNRVGLAAGARAWAKHAHRSMPVVEPDVEVERELLEEAVEVETGGTGDKGVSTSTSTDQSTDRPQPSTSTPSPSHPSDRSSKQKPQTKKKKKKAPEATGWWGSPKGSQSSVNARALEMFFKIMNGAVWRNLHWLPHEVLVYEVRVVEGYGMRWSRDQGIGGGEAKGEGGGEDEGKQETAGDGARKLWMFRGFVEPMMENGHELGWKHPLNLGPTELEGSTMII